MLCERCRAPTTPSQEERRLLSEAEIARLAAPFKQTGCDACRQTGFAGRKPLFEVMPLRSSEMRRLILSGCDADQIERQATQEGMTRLREAAFQAAEKGETSLGEAIKIMLAD